MVLPIVVALDGPAGSGKSTVARLLSNHLNFKYIDSGAIYRTLTLHGIHSFGKEFVGKERDIALFFQKYPDQMEISYENHTQHMWLNGENVSSKIRASEVTHQVRYVSDDPSCRELVNGKMRDLANRYPVVIDGRDIGTIVFPDTPYKFYLDAKPKIRATRRAKELNIPLTGDRFEKLLKEIIERDNSDMARAIAPLRRAGDAILVDTSNLAIEEVVDLIRSRIKL